MFGNDFDIEKRNYNVVKKEQQVKPINIELYRGFYGDLNKFKQDDQFYYFDPATSEQRQLWFTSRYITYYNPIEYAINHGDWFMTYSIPAKKHVEITHYEDGRQGESPRNMGEDSTKNSSIWQGIELPQGWLWSYKTEKFIGCTLVLKVPKTSVRPCEEVMKSL